MSFHGTRDITARDVLPQPSVSKKEICQRINIAIGIILLLGALFLVFACHRILPHGVNALSEMGIWGYVAGYGALLLGLIISISSLRVCLRDAHKEPEEEPLLVRSRSSKSSSFRSNNGNVAPPPLSRSPSAVDTQGTNSLPQNGTPSSLSRSPSVTDRNGTNGLPNKEIAQYGSLSRNSSGTDSNANKNTENGTPYSSSTESSSIASSPEETPDDAAPPGTDTTPQDVRTKPFFDIAKTMILSFVEASKSTSFDGLQDSENIKEKLTDEFIYSTYEGDYRRLKEKVSEKISNVKLVEVNEWSLKGEQSFTSLRFNITCEFEVDYLRVIANFDKKLESDPAVTLGATGIITTMELTKHLEGIKKEGIEQLERYFNGNWSTMPRPMPARVQIEWKLENEKTQLQASLLTNLGWWGLETTSNTGGHFHVAENDSKT